MSNPLYQLENGIFFLHKETPEEILRSEQLIRLAKKETHAYDDAEVREFPNTFSYNLHKEAWKQKSDLTDHFTHYLHKRLPQATEPYTVLQVCSGMGWLAAKLAEREDFQVLGLDNRRWLIEQSTRIFQRSNLKFLYGNLLAKPFESEAFDLIVIDDAIQYFPDLSELLDICLAMLKPEGEIHLLGNVLYSAGRIEAEESEQKQHLKLLACEAASEYLFLHSSETLKGYNSSSLAKGSGILGFLGVGKNNHSWLRILK